MSSKNDISQIKKYLNGELDARAMHELEKRALDDPFLMEAMQGYEQTGKDQRVNLDDLTNRLQQRLDDNKVRRMIPWMPLSIAASVLIVIGAGIWFFTGRKPEKPAMVAEVIRNQDKKLQDQDTVKAIAKQDKVALADELKPKGNTSTPPNTIAQANVPAPTVSAMRTAEDKSAASADVSPVVAEPTDKADIKPVFKPHKDSVSLNEVVVSSYKEKKKDSSIFFKRSVPAQPDQLLASRADGVTVTTTDESLGGHVSHMKTLNGVVVGSDDRQPITGATVKIVGAKFGAVTDAKGKFTLPNVSDNQTLSVGYLGYTPQKVKVSNKDSVNITLVPKSSSLAEVVVTNPSTLKTKKAVKEDKEAHPRDGWKALDAYLEKNAISTDGKTGKVKVSFTVGGDGSLINFKIIKSLSAIADQKAIDLVQYGIAWIGGADGKPKEVTVSVKFH